MAAEHEHHCPFLNRPDERCSEHFHLDALSHAFAYCFDRYDACPVYVERLVERRVRQQVSVVTEGQQHGRQTLVQITLPHRFAAHAGGGGTRPAARDRDPRGGAPGYPQPAGDAQPVAAA